MLDLPGTLRVARLLTDNERGRRAIDQIEGLSATNWYAFGMAVSLDANLCPSETAGHTV